MGSNKGLSALAQQTCPQGSGPRLGRSVWPPPGVEAGSRPRPFPPGQPQLLTEPSWAPDSGETLPTLPSPCGGWGGGQAGGGGPEARGHLPGLSVGPITFWLSASSPSPHQHETLVPLTTESPYFPPAFIRAGFALTGSGCGNLDRNKAALPLTLGAP